MRKSEKRVIYLQLDSADYDFVYDEITTNKMQLKKWFEIAISHMRINREKKQNAKGNCTID